MPVEDGGPDLLQVSFRARTVGGERKHSKRQSDRSGGGTTKERDRGQKLGHCRRKYILKSFVK